jgi:hypothetical protein
VLIDIDARHVEAEAAVRVGLYYRAGLPVPRGIHWFWIGTHGEYDMLIGSD